METSPNTLLPVEVLNKISQDAETLYNELDEMARQADSYSFGLPMSKKIKGPIIKALTEYAAKLHQAQQEIERRNKLLESNHKLSMRLNMIGCSEAAQEESWQDYKRRNNL